MWDWFGIECLELSAQDLGCGILGLGINHLHSCEVHHVYYLLGLEDSGGLVYDQTVMQVSIFCLM